MSGEGVVRRRPGRPAKPGVKERILERGTVRMLERGYGGIGVAELADWGGIPKGSFYNYFENKETFGEAVIDTFGARVVELLARELDDRSRPPLARLRAFFEGRERHFATCGKARGCLLGNFAMEVADHQIVLRRRLQHWLDDITARMAACIAEAQAAGDTRNPTPAPQLARFVVMSWEGALLAMRVAKDLAPLRECREVLFGTVLA